VITACGRRKRRKEGFERVFGSQNQIFMHFDYGVKTMK